MGGRGIAQLEAGLMRLLLDFNVTDDGTNQLDLVLSRLSIRFLRSHPYGSASSPELRVRDRGAEPMSRADSALSRHASSPRR
jgi:hypothetical protein